MIRFSKEYLRDRIYACWVGKNIGGTLGTPYEGRQQLNDIKGFASEKGVPLPNDDLDLQLVWLKAVDEQGLEHIDSKVLGEYWLSWITPNWNEYGVCKANMRDGWMPPMSGEINNEQWKHSNGAWIRTEIWASLCPAQPERAIRYAFEDASVDHGYAEGSMAAIFVAAMESAAFAISDARTLLTIGLSKIPENCRVARSVNIVIDAYDKGLSWQECRNLLVEDSADLGWFQAPANVGFVVLGLLYGEGDFKQSLIYAINCGDDTDCTGATLGALLGIMNGMAGIPSDWQEYIGDGIKSICLVNGHGAFPTTNQQLTDCIMNLLPATFRQRHQALLGGRTDDVCLADETLIDIQPEAFFGREFAQTVLSRKPYSFTWDNAYAEALIEFDEKPVIAPGQTLTGRVSMLAHTPTFPEQKHYRLRFILPEGWTANYHKNLFTPQVRAHDHQYASGAFAITAGDSVEAVNRIILEITSPGRVTPLLVPMQVMG